MPTVIDTLFVALKIKDDNFTSDSRKSAKEIEGLEKKIKQASKATKDNAEQQKKAAEQAEKFRASINNGVRALASLFTMVMGSVGLGKLVSDTAKANDELNFLSKRLGMSARAVSNWQGAADMAGGSAQGMASSMTSLHQSMVSMVTTGDTSIMPFLNGMGVTVTDVNGNLRSMDKVFLDLTSSLSRMERGQAFMFGRGLGLDDGTINMLVQGRKEVERQLALQKSVAVSSEKELALSRKFNELRALAMKQIEGIKNTLSNFLMPYFIKMLEKVRSFITLLSNNKDKTINFFKGLAAIISVALIPVLIRAAWSAIALFASVALIPALVATVATLILGLINDYNKWKEGSKSLIDWSKWGKDIEWIKKQFKKIGTSIGNILDKLGKLVNYDFSNFKMSTVFDAIIEGAKQTTTTLAYLLEALDRLSSGDFEGAGESLRAAGRASRGDYARRRSEKEVEGMVHTNPDEFDRLYSAGPQPKVSQNNSSFSDSSYKSSKDVSGVRGIRNNNPLNIMYIGQKEAAYEDGKNPFFAKYKTPYEGLVAARKQLMLYYTGKSRTTGGKRLQSIWDIVHKWAPKEHGNDPVHYANDVAGQLGMDDPKAHINLDNPEMLAKLIRAMGNMENGGYIPYSDEMIMAAVKGTGDPTKGARNNRSWLDRSLLSNAYNPMAFIGQTQQLQTQKQPSNNYVTANFGDINIKTSSSTVSGNVAEATESATSRMYQLIPSLR